MLLLLVAQLGYTQMDVINFNHLDDAAGLPNNLFRTTIQDQHGVLWMGGGDGLASYDGFTFTSYRHSDTDSTSISSNNISEIFEDSQGRLWVAMHDGTLNISDLAKSHFRTVHMTHWGKGGEAKRTKAKGGEVTKNNVQGSEVKETDVNGADVNGADIKGEEIKSDVSDVIISMAQDARHSIWAVSNTGLTIIEEKDEQFRNLSIEELIKTRKDNADSSSALIGRALTVFCDRGDSVWIGTTKGVYLFDVGANQLIAPSKFEGVPTSNVQSIARDRIGRIWLSVASRKSRMYYFDGHKRRFVAFDHIPFKSHSTGVTFTFDLDNRIWAAEFGVQSYAYDFRDSSLIMESRINSSAPEERFVRKPFVDHSGNVWIHASGYLVYPYPKNFNTYFHPFAFRQANTFTYEDDAYRWFGYWEEGVVRIDRKTREVVRFNKDSDKFPIPSNLVVDMVPAKSGNLILVAFGIIIVIKPSGKIVTSHVLRGTNRDAFVDSKGRIWIGGISGLHLFEEEKGVIKSYKLPPRLGDPRNFIQKIVEDSDGNIWFGSGLKGLAKLDVRTDSITQYLPDDNRPGSIPSERVHDILIDKNSALWIATDVALVRFEKTSNTFLKYNSSNGIPNDFIQSIIEDEAGTIWVSTNSGISSFDQKNEAFTNYTRQDGLTNSEFTRRGGYLAKDGLIYFGGTHGVDYFYPEKLRINPTPPIMRLTGITLDNTARLTMAELESDGGALELSYTNNLIEIGFAGMHFVSYGQVDNYYMMEGLNDEWIKLGEGRSVLYADLEPGNYTFRAKAKTSDHIWSENELAIPIHISPPFYETLWFKLSAAALAILLLLFIIKIRDKRIRKKQQIEAELKHRFSELETRALRAQMNPHFIYNCLNSIQHFMVTEDYEPAMEYLTRFSRVLRSVLGASGQSRLPLAEEIKMVEDYLELEQMRFPESFSYSINVDPALNIHSVEIPPFFIQPQVENAIRHGLIHKNDRCRIVINIDKKGDFVHIVVEDNGIGRDAARAFKLRSQEVHTGKGLSIIEERLAHMHHNGAVKPFIVTDLYNEKNEAIGTKVEVILSMD
jgi:ligand-binding sensor domain-containing protein